MNTFFYDSWDVILNFLIPGIFLGAIYDIFRFCRIARTDHTYNIKQKLKNRFFIKNDSDNKKTNEKHFEPTIVFIEDILFFIIVAVTEILALFHFNNGEIRICFLIVSATGFFVYQKTLGNLIVFFSKKILYFIRKTMYLLICIVLTPVLFIFKIFKKSLCKNMQKKKNSIKE